MSATGTDKSFLVDGQYSIVDLVDMEALRRLFEQFTQATGFTIGLLDHPGLNVLIASGWRDICTQYHRSCPLSLDNCIRSNRRLLDRLDQPGKLVIEQCDNGLVDCAIPIIIKGTHIASLATGQLLLAEPDLDRFRRQAKLFGFDEAAYLRALREIPVVSETQLRAITAFLGSMALTISETGYANLVTRNERALLAREVADRKLVEKELRTAKDFAENLIATANTLVVGLDLKGHVIIFNQAAERITGYSRAEIVGKDWFEILVPPARFPQVHEIFSRLSTNRLPHTFENPILTKTGDERYILWQNNELIENAQIVGSISFGLDVTDRRAAEAALRESEAKYRALFDGAAEGILVADAETTAFRYVNTAMCTMLGYTRDELLRLSVRDIHPADALSRVLTEFKTQLPDKKNVAADIPCQRKDGSVFLADIAKRTLVMDGRRMIVGFFSDTTEHRFLEERLRQSEKLTAIGQIASGVAHDFNNQLGIIMGCADMLHAALDNPELKGYAQNILDTVRRSADLTHKLLTFSRKSKLLTVPVDLHRLLTEVGSILERSIDKRISIHHLHHAERALVMGDPTELQSALLNLALNARDAMPQGGDLTFETGSVTFTDADCANHPHEISPGPFLVVSVTDTGTGMTENVKKRLFEPFFTTKKPGEGTGMGLAGVYGAVRSHHGTINIYSEVGRGTTVRIYLPLTTESVSEASKEDQVVPPIHGTARILIVEDEELLRNLVSAMLRPLGYRITTCINGRDGVAYYQDHWRDIDLVILDMIMPEMGGREAFLAMRQINPQIRALLSSGYSTNGEAQVILNEGVLGFIGKPYRQAELAQLVAVALTQKH